MKVTKDTIIGQLIVEKPDAIPTLMGFGLSCVGCPASQMETIEEAAAVHGIDVDKMLEALNN